MSHLPSMMEYSPYHSRLFNYGNTPVSSVIRAAVPLGPHKLSACKISCLCVCGFSVAKERRKRMEIHLRAPTTNFPSPRDCSGDREHLYY